MTVLQELGKEFFGSNAHELAYRPAERLVRERFASNLLRHSLYSHANGADERLPNAFVHNAFEHAPSHRKKVSHRGQAPI
jgi:hypothetical protein